jgi:hypothetical protein
MMPSLPRLPSPNLHRYFSSHRARREAGFLGRVTHPLISAAITDTVVAPSFAFFAKSPP